MGELLIILVLVVLFLGTKRLTQLGGGLGKAVRNFKQAARTDGGEAGGSGRPGASPRRPPGDA